MTDSTPSAGDDLLRLTEVQRLGLAAYWAKRSRAEREVGVAFSYLESALAGGASPIVLGRLRVAAKDEARHATLCEELAARFAGSAISAPPPRPLCLPPHDGAPQRLVPMLHLVALCAINETIATVWLRTCRALARSEMARRANHVHLCEELDHARIGWAHLGSPWMTEDAKVVLAERLVPMLRVSVGQWWEQDEGVESEGFPDEGVPSLEATRDAVLGAVGDVILPGFARAGVDCAEANRWFDGFCRASPEI